MKAISRFCAAVLLAGGAASALAQPMGSNGLGEVVVSASRESTSFADKNRPVVGLRRAADGAVMQFTITSDTREEAARKKEIHAALLTALDRAAVSGVEILSGAYQLAPVTRANYADLPFQGAGRVDTSKLDLMVKVRLTGSASAAEKRLTEFIKVLPGSGRAMIEKTGKLTLTVIDPDQYRDEVVKLIAEDARHYAAIFGPDYVFQITGIDGQVAWSQVSSTEVFLYLPYRYTIVPR